MTRTTLDSVAHRKGEFLAFVERERSAHLVFLVAKLGERALAEDILQDATLKALAKLESLRTPEALAGWFKSILRSTAIDHHRRTKVKERALDDLVHELGTEAEEAEETPCGCVGELKKTLKPEYADALDRVEIEGAKVADFASERGLSKSNAGVRVHRARLALRKKVESTCGACATNGCISCDCVSH